jgi:hypothetical protein
MENIGMNPYESFFTPYERRSQMTSRKVLVVAIGVVVAFAIADLSYFWLHATSYALMAFEHMIGM